MELLFECEAGDKRDLMKKVLLRLEDDLAERLDLASEALGGGSTRSGKKTAILRHVLEQVLPDEESLKQIIHYRRSNLYQRERMKQPDEPAFLSELRGAS